MQQTIIKQTEKPDLKVVKNLYQKLIEIRKQIPYLQKKTKGQNGQYVDGSTVLAEIRPKIDELGLLLVPSIVNSEMSNITVMEGNPAKEKVKQIVKCDMIFTWINIDNPDEKLEVPFACFGMQNDISMAFGSALTYTERYFLLKFFNIATDKDDPDSFANKSKKPNKTGVDVDDPDFEILLELKNQKSNSDVFKYRTDNIGNVADRAGFIKAVNNQLEAIKNGSL